MRRKSAAACLGAVASTAGIWFAIGLSSSHARPLQAPKTVPPAACESPTYKGVPPPDAIAEMMQQRVRWRLVIGTSEFRDSPAMNRPYVNATAKAVDDRLKDLGYRPLPSLAAASTQYLAGKAASKEAVTNALKELQRSAKKDDIAVVYFIGHGSITPSGTDLSLSVYDRPVAADEGVRVSDLVAWLSTEQVHRDVTEIPQFIVILETCYSGTISGNSDAFLAVKDGSQRLVQIQTPVIPPQMVLVSATAGNDLSRAYDLRGQNMSAFGYYFTRALKEDWACVDTTPDGILTVRELVGYLTDQLKTAYEKAAIAGPMVPTKLTKDEYAFLAYDPQKYSTPGDRGRIVTVSVAVPLGRQAFIGFGPGENHLCLRACSFNVSAALKGEVRVSSADRPLGRGGAAAAETFPDPLPPIAGALAFTDLMKRQTASVGGVDLTVR